MDKWVSVLHWSELGPHEQLRKDPQKHGSYLFHLEGRVFANTLSPETFPDLFFFFFFLKYVLFYFIGICFPTTVNWNHLERWLSTYSWKPIWVSSLSQPTRASSQKSISGSVFCQIKFHVVDQFRCQNNPLDDDRLTKLGFFLTMPVWDTFLKTIISLIQLKGGRRIMNMSGSWAFGTLSHSFFRR